MTRETPGMTRAGAGMTRETPGMASLFGKHCVSLRGLGRFWVYHDVLKNGFFMIQKGDFCGFF